MVEKESRYVFWAKAHTEVIPPERIQQNIDLSKVVDDFSTHKCHPGGWPANNQQPAPTPDMRWSPPVNYTSHIVREVSLNEDGGLLISFDFYHTLRGSQFMDEYYEHDDFKMVPVLDEGEINIVRFDFIREIKDGHT